MTTPAPAGTTTTHPNGDETRGDVNVVRMNRDHAMARAKRLEQEATDLVAKARAKFAEAAVCRMHAATAGEGEEE